MPDLPPVLELSTTLSLRSGEQSWGTERRMALLAAIDSEGSISAAARKVGLSYKAAWDAVDMMNNAAGGLLVERVTGGRRGGGASLTARARELVVWYQAIHAEHQRFMDLLARFGPDGARHLDLLQSMALQTSARNRLGGIVTRIEPGRINDRVHLQVEDGITLVATVTHASTERLALTPGRPALAFIKAQAVSVQRPGASTLATGTRTAGTCAAGNLEESPDTAPDAVVSAADPTQRGQAGQDDLNRWRGRVSHQVKDADLTEITLEIAQGIHITGFADRTHTDLATSSAGFAPGDTAEAVFRPADILIGTRD